MNRALSKACEELAEDLLYDIFRTYREEVSDQRIIEVVLSGVSACGEVDKFKKVLQENLRGIRSIDQRVHLKHRHLRCSLCPRRWHGPRQSDSGRQVWIFQGFCHREFT